MNIQKIFDALNEDEMNSSLGIICAEFENQGYRVKVNSVYINSEGVFEGQFDDLEKLQELEIELMKDGKLEQKFLIEFVEYHNIIVKSA